MGVLGGLRALGNNLMLVVLTLNVLIDKPFGTNESGGQSKPISNGPCFCIAVRFKWLRESVSTYSFQIQII